MMMMMGWNGDEQVDREVLLDGKKRVDEKEKKGERNEEDGCGCEICDSGVFGIGIFIFLGIIVNSDLFIFGYFGKQCNW